MDIEIVDYQYGFAKKPIQGTRVFIDDEEILDVDTTKGDSDVRVLILESVLKHLKIEADVNVLVDLD